MTGDQRDFAVGTCRLRGHNKDLQERARMSQEGITPDTGAASSSDVNIAHELMEEDLQREIARNQAANKMVMEKEMAALAARKRAEESQQMMQSMLSKYEEMRVKLESTKSHLDETNSKISEQEKLTDKISQMKERVEAYANKKKAVNCLEGHVKLKMEVVNEETDEAKSETPTEGSSMEKTEETIRHYSERVNNLKASMAENDASMQKREDLKKSLEKAIELGEKRAAEQNRITTAREKMLELKLKELELQKAKLARKKREQEVREQATNDFCSMIDKELEDMESKIVAQETGTVPKNIQNKAKGKGKKSKSNTPNVLSPKVMSPEPTETSIAEKDKKKKKNKSAKISIDSQAAPQKPPESADKTDNEKTEAQANAMEQIEKVNSGEDLSLLTPKVTEEEIRATVDKIEGKVKSVRGNIADIAMSEQYLRTKQAMLIAKKKDQEKKIAENIADIREAEVIKMKEKVKHMQELLHQRKEKLKATEEIMHAKNAEKDAIDKIIEQSARRENYLEKEKDNREIVDKKPPTEDQ